MTTTKQTPAEFIRDRARAGSTPEADTRAVLAAFPHLTKEQLVDAFRDAGNMLMAEADELERLAALPPEERKEVADAIRRRDAAGHA